MSCLIWIYAVCKFYYFFFIGTLSVNQLISKHGLHVVFFYSVQEHVNETVIMRDDIDYNTEDSEQLLRDGDSALKDALENTRVGHTFILFSMKYQDTF